jgi:ATP-dependent DNA ligase
LDQLISPNPLVRYTEPRATVPFLLFSKTIRKKQECEWLHWPTAIKYNGIRIAIEGRYGITRSGLQIDLKDLTWFPETATTTDFRLDAELCMPSPGSTHLDVMSRVNSGKLSSLVIRIFDYIPNDPTDVTTFSERIARLQRQKQIPSANLVTYQPAWTYVQADAPTTEECHDVVLKLIQAVKDKQPDQEGLVVRNPHATYFGHKRDRDNAVGFKLK